MHIELIEHLRCPEEHREEFLVLSTSEMNGRMVWLGVVGCPVCHRDFEIVDGIVDFTAVVQGKPQSRSVRRTPAPASPVVLEAKSLQALLDLGGPGGFVVLLGSASRHAVGLAALMGGVHFVGINAPPDVEPLPPLSLLQCDRMIPLRRAMARSVVVGAEVATTSWVAEARRVLLPGRRLVIEREGVTPEGVKPLAVGDGLWVGEKR
ncbi:MAG TPA: hypothetical protein VEO73_13115 [Gemmatimonadales bacterium]|nr:hypothetical protein [Gemmatimonadales bacterium]